MYDVGKLQQPGCLERTQVPGANNSTELGHTRNRRYRSGRREKISPQTSRRGAAPWWRSTKKTPKSTGVFPVSDVYTEYGNTTTGWGHSGGTVRLVQFCLVRESTIRPDDLACRQSLRHQVLAMQECWQLQIENRWRWPLCSSAQHIDTDARGGGARPVPRGVT